MKTLAKYVAFARIGLGRTAAARSELYGRALFFAVLLGVFSALWRTVARTGMPIAASPSALVWYLAATEWILLSPEPLYLEIEGDVRRGDIACHLVRPCSYLVAMSARGLGALVLRAPLFAATAIVWAFLFTDRLPDPRALALVGLFGVGAMLLIQELYVLTGLAAFWVGDVSPLFWLWQKVLLTLGGLMLPLSLYPTWIQHVARMTPFPWLLAEPAGLLIGPTAAWPLVIHLAGWGVVIVLITQVVFRRAVRTIEITGG